MKMSLIEEYNVFNMDLKLVKIASIREHMDAHYRGEISYSKAIDLINEDANKQLALCNVVGQSEQLKAVEKLKDFAYQVCPLHREDDLEEITGSL